MIGGTMKLPTNITDLFKAAMDIETAKKSVVAVNVFIDESTSREFQVFVRAGFNSESPNSRVMISYVPTQNPDVDAPCDIAVIAAANSVESVALAAALKSVNVPTLVVTEDPEGLKKRAQEMGHPLDDENVVAPKEGQKFHDGIKDDLADEIGSWIVKAQPEKRLAFSIAYPFVKRPLSLEAVYSTSAQNAGIGLVFFLPGADLPLMVINQAKMVLQIAAAYGHTLSVDRIKELAAVLGSAFVFRTVARLTAGLVPGLGWAIKTAIAYGGTAAIGNAAVKYFENGGDMAGLAAVVATARDSFMNGVSVFKKKPSAKQALSAVSTQAYNFADTSLKQIAPVLESAGNAITSALKPGRSSKKKSKKKSK